MSGSGARQFETVTPSEADVVLALESARRLASHSIGNEDIIQLQMLDESVSVPSSAVRLFLRVLLEMSKGHGVTLIPNSCELSVHESAAILNVSRSYMTRLLDEGRVSSKRNGLERTIRLDELTAYKATDDEARAKVADQLVAEAQELQMGY